MLDSATCSNAADSDTFLDRRKPSYLGGIVEMGNDRLYPVRGKLAAALRTGKPRNDISHEIDGEDIFEAMYQDPARLEQFRQAMAGVQMGNFAALVESSDFSRFKMLCNFGGASAALSVLVARCHPHMRCIERTGPERGKRMAEITRNGLRSDRSVFSARILLHGELVEDAAQGLDVRG